MKKPILERIANRFGFFRRSEVQSLKRTYAAAALNRLTADWNASVSSADAEIATGILTLRSRSRQQERDGAYLSRYLDLIENNVIGCEGIGLQMKVVDLDGNLDKQANVKIEEAWYQWGKKANCTIARDQTWVDLQNLALRSAARDGTSLCRKIRGADNAFSFALQPIEADQLDTDYSAKLDNGREVKLGVERNASGRVTAYYLLTSHPGEMFRGGGGRRRERIPAEEIIHLFRRFRVGQSIGVPWGTPAMLSMHHLDGYDEAELIAAREGACKGGFFKKPTIDGFTGESVDSAGNQISEMQPGQYEQLNPGWDFVPNHPEHPTTAYPFFVKACLRKIASALNVSYNSLANDLEGVNFSSIRAGVLEDREFFKKTQRWLIDHFCQEVFDEWLPLAIASGQVRLPISKLAKFAAGATWKPRRWSWVDPEKDINAQINAVGNGFRSRRSIIAEQGGDIEEVFQEIADDEELAKSYGLKFGVAADAHAEAEAVAENTPKPKDPERSLTPVPSPNGTHHQNGDPVPVLHAGPGRH